VQQPAWALPLVMEAGPWLRLATLRMLFPPTKAVAPHQCDGGQQARHCGTAWFRLRARITATGGGVRSASMVRFGKSCSGLKPVRWLPLFREQIARRRALYRDPPRESHRLLHDDHIPEAAQLVLAGRGLRAQGGEVFLLDMGERLPIVDTRAPDGSALRLPTPRRQQSDGGHLDPVHGPTTPAEKLYEELLIGDSDCPQPPIPPDSSGATRSALAADALSRADGPRWNRPLRSWDEQSCCGCFCRQLVPEVRAEYLR